MPFHSDAYVSKKTTAELMWLLSIFSPESRQHEISAVGASE